MTSVFSAFVTAQVGTCIVWPYDGPTGEVDANSTADQATHKAANLGVSCHRDPWFMDVYTCLCNSSVFVEGYLNLAWRDRCLRRWAMCYHIRAIILIHLDLSSSECADLWQDYLVKIADEEVLRSFEAVVEISPESLDGSLWFSPSDMPGRQCRMERRVKSRYMKNYPCICARLCHLLAQTPIWSYM